MNIDAVGIDVSKGKSTIVILQLYGEIISSPFETKRIPSNIQPSIEQTRSIESELRIATERTGRYYEPLIRKFSLVGLFVTAVNSKLVKNLGTHPLRKVKSDKTDVVKIARYTSDNWTELKQYSLIDELRNQPKIMNRQSGFYMKHKTAMENNLIGTLDQAYPGTNTCFDGLAREDGSQKRVDFATTCWHVDYVRKFSLNVFVDHCQKWCKRRKYNFSKDRAEEIYGAAKEPVSTLLKDDLIRLIVKQSIEQLNTASKAVEEPRALANDTTAKLSECLVIMGIEGIDPSLDPQPTVEAGDVTCFIHRGAITVFADVDPGVNESGTYEQKNVPTSERGSSSLRKTLSQVVDCFIKTEPQDDLIYVPTNKKRVQGKSYYVYMTIGANKLSCIYYRRVKEYLVPLPEQRISHPFRPTGSGGLFAVSEI